jgi:SET domain-containing protein
MEIEKCRLSGAGNEFTREARALYKSRREEILASVPLIAELPPRRLARPLKINQPHSHPAHSQFGLFAVAKIPARTLILNYCGLVHTEPESDPNSDYDLRFLVLRRSYPKTTSITSSTASGDEFDILSIDASNVGSEARFINDYRGIMQRPNVEFQNYRNRRDQVNIGVFSISQPIEKGQELCVTYKKGFWDARSQQSTVGTQ